MNWHLLGVKLGLEDHELRTIDQDFRGDGSDRCKHEMLGHWLRNAKGPTWKAVADALCLMGEHAVALKIRAKYCSDTGKPMYSYSCGARLSPSFRVAVWLHETNI